MTEYVLEEYLRRQKFLDDVEKRGINPYSVTRDPDELRQKRDAWRILYPRMMVEGGDLLPVDECRAKRVNAAFKREYDLSQRFVADFPVVRPLIARTQELLSLEEIARDRAASVPLFETQKYNQAQEDTRAYLTTLTAEQLRIMKERFGGRIKPYLTNSGRLKTVAK